MDKDYKKYVFATSKEWEFAKMQLLENLKNFPVETSGKLYFGYVKCIKTIDEWKTEYETRRD